MKVVWTRRAILEYEVTIQYLLSQWTDLSAVNFIDDIQLCITRITRNPKTFPLYKESERIRCATVNKHTQVFYLASEDSIQIVTIWNTRRDPNTLKIE